MMMWTERPQGGKSRADGAEREVGRDGGAAEEADMLSRHGGLAVT